MRGESGGLFSYYVWDAETDMLKPLFMIQESHETRVDLAWKVTWSDDSQAINFSGETQKLGKFNFVHYIPTGKNYKL